MARNTVHMGASMDPMDAPNAKPSEEAYEDAMARHGTDEFSSEDERLVTRYQELRRKENEQPKDENTGRVLKGNEHLKGNETEGGEGVSRGTSSSISSGKTGTKSESSKADDQSPVRTTENPSSRDRVENSTARTTDGQRKK